MKKEKFIPVFIDAKPSENLEPATRKTLCFVGILSNSMSGISKLKGYKNTGKEYKTESAQRIIDALSNKDYKVDAIGLASRTDGQFVQWACETINRLRERLKAEWEVIDNVPTHLKWKGNRLDRATVLGLSTYASILPIIALRAEILTNSLPIKKIKLCLDKLPNNFSLGMDLMKEFKDEPMIAEMWKENMKRGATFEVGIFDKWQKILGKWSPAKKHPNSILVDWFAASCMANINPQQLQEEGNYSIKEIEKIAEIWRVSNSKNILNLDDNELLEKIKAHNTDSANRNI